MNNLEEARHKLAEHPDTFAQEDPVLFHILENPNLSQTEKNLLVTEIFQGGIDAVTIFNYCLCMSLFTIL